MKKTLIILLLVLSLGCIGGCGKKDSDTTDDGNDTEEVSQMQGSWSDDTYSNDYTGISFTLPSGWFALTGDQITSVIQNGSATISDNMDLNEDDLNAQVSETDYYDFYVTNATGSAKFCLDIVDLVKSNDADMTEEQYLQQRATDLESMTSISVTCEDPQDSVLHGEDVKAMNVSFLDSDGNVIGIESIFAIKKESYMFVYLASATDNAGVDEVQSIFDQIG